MIKKSLILLFASLAITANAQKGTLSPYSGFGLGDNHYKGMTDIATIGEQAVFKDSLHINTLNPASYADLKATTYAFGFSNKINILQTSKRNAVANSSAFDYFALAFPIEKFGVGFGIMPQSFTGYNIENNIVENNHNILKKINGEGGINRAFIGISYKPFEDFSMGVETSYNFGDIHHRLSKSILNDGSSFFVDRGTEEYTKNYYRGFSYNTAINYTPNLYGNVKLYTAITFSPEIKWTNEKTTTFSTFKNDNNTRTGSQEIENLNRKISIPMKYSLGMGIGNPNQWYVGAEYSANNNEKYNTFLKYPNATYTNGYKIALGGSYTPNHLSFTNYFHQVTYRLGIKYEHTGLVVSNHNINNTALLAGVGLPISMRSISNINIGLEVGQRGTTNNNLIKENYINLSVGLSFNDLWFVKRKYE